MISRIKWLLEAMIDYRVGSWPGHPGKGVGIQVGALVHLLLGFGSSSRLETKCLLSAPLKENWR